MHESLPDGLIVMHSCDTPRCVNPAHLSQGTQADNAHDRDRKGRWVRGRGNTKLTAEQVAEIRECWPRKKWGDCLANVLALRYGVSRYAVYKVVNGETHAHH